MEDQNATSWPYKSDIAVVINPVKRGKVLWGCACLALFLIIFLGPVDDKIQKWAYAKDHEKDVALLAPTMQKLADQGKPDAIRWVAANLPDMDHGRLAMLAAHGDGEALFTMALASAKTGTNKDVTKRLLSQSADAGYLPAVKAKLNVLTHKVTKWE